MIRYADPGLCPDCRAPITGSMVNCGTCGLPLRGLVAQRLFTTLQQADTLLTSLRSPSPAAPASAQPVPASSPTGTPTAADPATGPSTAGTRPAGTRPAGTPPTGAPHGLRDQGRGPAPRPALSAASVPTILLSLGAGCLLIAALVFLAVTWAALGVGGRTAVLVVLTLVAAALAAWLGRRGLRSACEALAMVSFGLLTLDLAGANSAGWFGDLSTEGFLVLLGVVLVLTGAGAALAARRTAGSDPDQGRPGRLIGAELVAALATALVVLGDPVERLFGDSVTTSAGLVAYVLVLAATTALAHRSGLPVAAAGTAAVTALTWSALTVTALIQVGDKQDRWHDLWVGFAVWPLLAAAGLVAAVALIRRLPPIVRVGAVAVGHLLLVFAVLAPTRYLDQTQVALVALAVLVLTTLLTWALPSPWALANGLTQSIAGVGVLVVVASLAGRAVGRLGTASDFSWGGGAGDVLPATWVITRDAIGPGPDLDGLLAAWLLPLGLLGLAAAAGSLRTAITALLPRLPRPNRPGPASPNPTNASLPNAVAVDLAAGIAAAAAVLTLALYEVPIWTVLTLILLVAAAFTVRWLVTRDPAALLAGVLSGACALVLATHALWLVGPTLLVLTCAALLVHVRSANGDLAAGGGITTSLGVGAQIWVWGEIGGLEPNWRAVLAAALLGLVVLGAGFLPDRAWRSRPDNARGGLEVGAALAYVPVAVFAVTLAPDGSQPGWAAVHLTLAGAVVSALALLRPDRRDAGWLGGALLAAASWVRLWEIGVREPEPYTLPAATVLVLLGLLRLRRDTAVGTLTALSPGLTLALLPSLLWALDDPVGLRSLLLGGATLALVLAGASLRWAAPLLLGGSAGALLVLRLAGPFVGAAVPRWVLIGLAGALLLAVGATWERRLQQARAVSAYVRGLR